MLNLIEENLESAINTHNWLAAQKWQALRNYWCYGTRLAALIGKGA